MANRSYSSLLEKGNYQKEIIKILDRKDKDQRGKEEEMGKERKEWQMVFTHEHFLILL